MSKWNDSDELILAALVDEGCEYLPAFMKDQESWRHICLENRSTVACQMLQHSEYRLRKCEGIRVTAVKVETSLGTERLDVMFHDEQHKLYREMAPCHYCVDYRLKKLFKLKWWVEGKKMKSGAFWGTMIEKYPNIYRPIYHNEKITGSTKLYWKRQRISLSPINAIPAPAYLLKHTYQGERFQFVYYYTFWEWQGKRVRMGQYWYHAERRITVI